jgi:hypothetical protein
METERKNTKSALKHALKRFKADFKARYKKNMLFLNPMFNDPFFSRG